MTYTHLETALAFTRASLKMLECSHTCCLRFSGYDSIYGLRNPATLFISLGSFSGLLWPVLCSSLPAFEPKMWTFVLSANFNGLNISWTYHGHEHITITNACRWNGKSFAHVCMREGMWMEMRRTIINYMHTTTLAFFDLAQDPGWWKGDLARMCIHRRFQCKFVA